MTAPKAFGFLIVLIALPAVAARLLGIPAIEGILAYLGVTGVGVGLGFGALHLGEFLGYRLLERPSLAGPIVSRVGGSHAISALCLLLFLSGWCLLTGYAAHHFGHPPYLGVLVVTGSWIVVQSVMGLAAAAAAVACDQIWLALGSLFRVQRA